MIGADRHPRVCALGFWLPCDQANFYHHIKDKELERRVALDRSYPEENELDVAVMRRLVTVLPYKDYTHYFPVYHTSFARTSDPDAAVFIYEQAGEKWKPNLAPDIEVHGVTLIVTASGFYLWLALYSIPQTRKHQRIDEDQVRHALEGHIRDLVGGDYFSHFSGLEDDQPRASIEDREQSIKEYRDKHQGILTFFQLNTILEGLFNSTLDFRVFFFTDQQRGEIERAKREYAVGKFIASITAHLPISQRKWTESDHINEEHLFPEHEDATLAEHEEIRIRELLFEMLTLHLEDSAAKVPASASARRMAHQLCRSYLSRLAGERLLRRFLHVTAAETLLRLKRRVERCRRALLGTMIEVTHRQQPLIQVESPDEPHDRIVGVNPAQLRGYIMLFSAKLPLIANVRFYLKELRIGDQELSEEDPVRVPYHTWLVLLRALVSDVRGLERALEQARTDALVHEEEQMRREEETIAEIERIQERSGQSLEPATTLAISVLSNVLAFVAVLLAMVSIVAGTPKGQPWFAGLPAGWSIVAYFIVGLFGVVVIIAFYAIAQLLFTSTLSSLMRFHRRERSRNDHYYYEMDLHVDRDMSPDIARSLLNHTFAFPSKARHDQPTQKELAQVGLAFVSPQRNSYRVERNSEDEALHKVYIDVDMLLAREHRWAFRQPRIHAVLVFEIMFHRPAKAETYIFQDVRVVATTRRILTPQQIDATKRIAVRKFVNPLIPGAPIRLDPEYSADEQVSHPVDALFSLAEPTAVPQPTPNSSTLARGINAIVRKWPVPVALYAVSIVGNATAFFATHSPADALSWEGLAHLSLFDTLLLVLGQQPALILLSAILVLLVGVIAWPAVRYAALQPPQPVSEGAPAPTDGPKSKPLNWPHPALLALGALGLAGTLVALAGIVLHLSGQ
jgi:hypothetical protein